ncbi:MAG: hypothetical protein JXR25_08850 [Pontiellaceae bacterium]|nr:hypothetical protein [Pontiellaceae bacterium]MBN2784923.1 hypothetical protein [Pontiellaceae bacterium]
MINWFAALLPYAAVLIGMGWFKSAWAAIGLYHLGIAGFLIYRKPPDLIRRLCSGFPPGILIPGIIVCALSAPVVYYLWPWLAVSGQILPEWLAHFGLTGRAWLLLIPYFSLVHPVLEEVHWRGIAPAPFRLICWQDLLFAGYHLLVLYRLIAAPWLIVVFGVLVSSSVFWRWTATRFGGYGTAILTHATADAGVILAVYFMVSR